MYETFAQARRALDNEETSCHALVSSFLARIEADGQRLNLFTSVDAEGALRRARLLDDERIHGTDLPLAGLVVVVKDVIAMKGRRLTCASRMLEDFVSLYDATVVERLEAAGAVVVARANCDAFGMGSSNENSHFGPARNPHAPAYVPGGSSGGSAGAVAAGMCHVALGTDTGGSIRQPAAFCGVVGLKPTYGRVSRYGLVAFASSFDTIGPLSHTVQDAAVTLGAMAGADRRDATSAPAPVPAFEAALTGDVAGVRIGIPREYLAEGLDPAIRELVEQQAETLREHGAEVTDVSLPHTRYGIAAYYILSTAEASSNLGRYDGVRYGHRADVRRLRKELHEERAALDAALAEAADQQDGARVTMLREQADQQATLLQRLYETSRTEGFGDEVKRRIMLGTYVLSSGYYEAYYGRAQRVRTLIRQDFDRAFEDVDVLLTPAAPTTAFRLGENVDDPLAMYLNDVYTVTASLAGIPGLSVPIGHHPDPPHLPVGMQLLGRPFDEAMLLRVGSAVEKALKVGS